MPESSIAGDLSTDIENLEYLQALKVNVSDFVTVKLCKHNFQIWDRQIWFLLYDQMMADVALGYSTWDRGKSVKTIAKKYESLVKRWILGTVSEELLTSRYYALSPKQILDELRDSCRDHNPWKRTENISRTRIIDKPLNDEGPDTELRKKLHDAVIKGSWWSAKSILKNHAGAETMVISSKRYTLLDLAVREGHNYFVKKLLNFIKDGKLIEQVNMFGTSLHVAAKFGNTGAAKLLAEKRKELLYISDHRLHVPLRMAFEERQLSTFIYLLEVTENSDEYLSLKEAAYDSWEIRTAVDLLTKAMSTKEYDVAMKLLDKFPDYATMDSKVLIALIRNFPSELGPGEALMYPSFKNLCQNVVDRIYSLLFYSWENLSAWAESALWSMRSSIILYSSWWPEIIIILLFIIGVVLCTIYQLARLLILVLLFPLRTFYYLLWKAFAFVVPSIKCIEKKKKEHKEAEVVTQRIYKCHTRWGPRRHYQLKEPILEAARLDADSVLRQFIWFSDDPMTYLTANGHDIMQLAVINRSSKVYKLIRPLLDPSEYNTLLDNSGNNLGHLAGRLPPLFILSCKTGAALQLQGELQWFEEVTKYGEPDLLTGRNIDDETPEMVFTREHAHLVKEGENWMKTTAESCSITAALIVTIVFAAAITVPGGSDSQTGIPVFKKKTAFTIFGVSDAISLFTGATSLSVFLSILTTRFAEKDFLVVLPRRLLIGLFLLLLSTTAMMVAFSTILYIVFCDQRQWMLAPIGALACVPIAAIVFLQFPLMFDIFQSTYFPIIGKKREQFSFATSSPERRDTYVVTTLASTLARNNVQGTLQQDSG